jgi:hypothetical protein
MGIAVSEDIVQTRMESCGGGLQAICKPISENSIYMKQLLGDLALFAATSFSVLTGNGTSFSIQNFGDEPLTKNAR